jgi:hypothetical protein
MYCANCGARLEEGQSFCSACGKSLQAGPTPSFSATPRVRGRVAGHIQVLAILWIVYSLFRVAGGFAMIFFGGMGLSFIPMHAIPFPFRSWIMSAMAFGGIMFLAYAAAGFVAAWGLFQRQSWARILTLVLGFLALLQVPFGTALGIYSLWVLLPSESGEEYRQMAH